MRSGICLRNSTNQTKTYLCFLLRIWHNNRADISKDSSSFRLFFGRFLVILSWTRISLVFVWFHFCRCPCGCYLHRFPVGQFPTQHPSILHPPPLDSTLEKVLAPLGHSPPPRPVPCFADTAGRPTDRRTFKCRTWRILTTNANWPRGQWLGSSWRMMAGYRGGLNRTFMSTGVWNNMKNSHNLCAKDFSYSTDTTKRATFQRFYLY